MGSFEEFQVDISGLTLPDAYDKEVSLSDYKGKVIVLSGGGQGTIQESEKWDPALAEACAEKEWVQFFALGFLKNLPSFVPKAMIKANVKNGPPTLLDWDGKGEELMGLTRPDMIHVFVVDKNNMLRYRLISNYSREALKSVMEKVEEIMPE